MNLDYYPYNSNDNDKECCHQYYYNIQHHFSVLEFLHCTNTSIANTDNIQVKLQ